MSGMLATELLAAADEQPDSMWVRFLDGDSFTYGEFARLVVVIAENLLALEVAPGERVVTFVDNRYELLATWFAAHLAAVVVVPLNTALRGGVLDQVLRETTPRVVVMEDRYRGLLGPRLAVLPSPPRVVTVGRAEDAEIPFATLTEPSTRPPGSVTLDVDTARLCCLMYTSGTTGVSKGACYCNGYHLQMGVVGRDNMQYGPDDVLYTCLPLFHGNALNTSVTPALVARAALVVGSRFSASGFWRDAAASGATATNLLGAMTPILLRRPVSREERAHSISRALVIPAPPEYHVQLPQRFGMTPIEAYGLTDGAMVLWCPPGGHAPPGSCGIPTSGYEVGLVDEKDDLVQGEGVGELVFRPAAPWTMALGYWRRPEATVQTWRNLWFHTGDLLRRDGDGWYYFVDRVKDVIRRRGENVSALEVENAVRDVDGVVDCAAYALPSELTEDEVAVALVVGDGWSYTERELVEHLTTRLPYYAVPRYIRFVRELPMTETQKVRKQVLRDDGPSVAWDREKAGVTVSRSTE